MISLVPRLPGFNRIPSRAKETGLGPFAYSTTFLLTENPIVEDGGWRLGAREGTNWQDVRTSGGVAYGVAVSAAYDDCLACRTGFPTKYYVEAVCSLLGGYSPGTSHENELLVGWSIAPGVAKGYECTWGIGQPLAFARWNGAPGNFTFPGGADDNLSTGKSWLDTTTGSGGSPLVDGDTARIEYEEIGGNPRITAYRNGTQILQVSDTGAFKIVGGNPGMGFFARTGATMSSYCWTSWQAGVF